MLTTFYDALQVLINRAFLANTANLNRKMKKSEAKRGLFKLFD